METKTGKYMYVGFNYYKQESYIIWADNNEQAWTKAEKMDSRISAIRFDSYGHPYIVKRDGKLIEVDMETWFYNRI